MSGSAVPVSLYVYAPNKIVPIVFTALYAISATGHIWQCWRRNAWKLAGLHALCGVLFTAGYATREWGTYNYLYAVGESKKPLMIYIMSQVFVYICPPLLELANYQVLSRTFFYVPYQAPIAPKRVFAIFGPVMMLVETLNALGVAFTSNVKSSNAAAGKILVLVAIGIQICLIFTFFCLCGTFHFRCLKHNVQAKAIPNILYVMYLSMLLILARSIYRIVQHAGNSSIDIKDPESMKLLSPLLRYEWFFYVFDGATMLVNSLLWNICHASRYLPRNKNTFMGEDGRTEMMWEEGGDSGMPLTMAEIGRGFMQVLTIGAWNHLFPPKHMVDDLKHPEIPLENPGYHA